ncbi:MAG: HAMP domain-containing histidine kinase, partial [Chloroflexi bacterium]|nr:HAMP domain-containing histidine kinase [Chloroflexota bacterium]
AHELRTPLARAHMTAELAVRRRRSAADLRAALGSIVADLDTTSVALDVLLAAARGGDTHPRAVCDAGSAAEAAVTEARGLPGSESLSWSVWVAEPLPLAGCDAPYLVRTLAPILQNAETYARAQVDVQVTTSGEGILFRVTDDGPGMTELDARHIGEPGFRGSAAGDRPGHGLGLTLAMRMARSAGGTVSVATGPGGRVDLRVPGVVSRDPRTGQLTQGGA